MAKVKYSLFIGLVCLMVATQAFAWMINEDYQQRDSRPATDFEIWLKGDVQKQITGGGQSGVTNPFDNPTRTITLTDIGNTCITFKGSNIISQDLNKNKHFGIYGTGKKPKVRFKAWSYTTSPYIVPVPKSNFDLSYNQNARELTITVENISDDTVTFSGVGYLLNYVERPIEDLNRNVLPPESFISLPELNREYAVGESSSIVIPNVEPTMFAITYATVTFTGASAGNRYDDFGVGTGGEWAQVAVIDQVPEAVPTVSQWSLIVMALLLLTVGVAVIRRRLPAVSAAMVILLFLPALSYAGTPGNHAGTWTKGQTIKVCVDTPPPLGGNITITQAEFYEAVFEAMAEWNVAQANPDINGLTFEYATENCDVQISWHEKYESWGTTDPGTGPVKVTIESDDGLNARGLTRLLKHELGHVEGLGHSDLSTIMKWNYPSSTNDAAKAADWNRTDPFETPNDDDMALKKKLYGMATVKSKSNASGTADKATDKSWTYDYSLEGLVGPGLVDPVTRFTLDLPEGVSSFDFAVTQMPPGWQWAFFQGEPADRGASGGKPTDTEEGLMPAILTFWTPDPNFGIMPGQIRAFQITSPRAPMNTRTFTNSPHYDSNEFVLAAPGGPTQIPTVSEWGLIVMAGAMLIAGAIVIVRRRQVAV